MKVFVFTTNMLNAPVVEGVFTNEKDAHKAATEKIKKQERFWKNCKREKWACGNIKQITLINENEVTMIFRITELETK